MISSNTDSRLNQARRYIAKVPPAVSGQGGHDQTFHVACILVQRFSLPESDALTLLQEFNQRCQPPWSAPLLAYKLRSAMRASGGNPGTASKLAPTEPAWPVVNEEQRAAIVQDGPALADLWELSPFRLDTNDCHTDELIDLLFPGNPLICAGVAPFRFDTRPRSDWKPGELERRGLIVPSPMSTLEGKTQDGKTSRHTLGNTGPRKFLVVEFDTGSIDEHAALLKHLDRFGGLVMAVHSGGKSLHGWFTCRGQTEERLLRFMRYAVSLGADHATWLRSQFVRTPDALREDYTRQGVFYLNPACL